MRAQEPDDPLAHLGSRRHPEVLDVLLDLPTCLRRVGSQELVEQLEPRFNPAPVGFSMRTAPAGVVAANGFTLPRRRALLPILSSLGWLIGWSPQFA